jgi:hypothetical protein
MTFWKRLSKRIFGEKKPSKIPTQKPKTSQKPTETLTNNGVQQTTEPKNNSNNMASKKLYALIVGINDYKYVTKLGGCVNDATRIKDYLEKATKSGDFEYHPILLTNEAATKGNIVKGFEEHLTKAGADDVAVFYFSGHGAQEQGDTVWKISESDGALETMVCYDSRDEKGTPDLADKELRYLIHKVAKKKPHILVIADSCHSGDNTRPSELVKKRLPDPDQAEPRLSALAPMRTWDKFCFAKEIPKEKVASANALGHVIPEGKHIQMGACKDKELAYELKGSGIFTSMLLDVLERSSGKVSYNDLRQRINFTVKGKYPQSPQIYASSQDGNDLEATFLGGASAKEPYYYNVQRNFRSTVGWNLDIGAIHGMPSAEAAKKLKIEIYDPKNKAKALTTATVKSVEPGRTLITMTNEAALDPNAQYLAAIEGLFVNPVYVYLHGDKEGVAVLEKAVANDKEFERTNLKLTKNLVLANYMVYAKKGTTANNYYIGLPMNDLSKIDKYYSAKLVGDSSPTQIPYWRWLTEQQEGFTQGSAAQIITFLKAAANWTFLKNLNNPTTTLKSTGVELNVYQVPHQRWGAKEKLKFDADGAVEVRFDSGSNPVNTSFLIDIVNNSNKTYFVAVPTLFAGFEVVTQLIPNGVFELEAGQTVKANAGDLLPFFLPDWEGVTGEEDPDEMQEKENWWIKDFNWRHKSFVVKLIISTEEFSVNDFEMRPMPLPRPERGANTRGFGGAAQIANHTTKADWTAETYEIRVLNPFYVKPPEEV